MALHLIEMSCHVRPMTIADFEALVAGCLADLGQLRIPKCNIFLLADKAEGEAFWKHIGWSKRPDLQVMQKALAGTCQKSGD